MPLGEILDLYKMCPPVCIPLGILLYLLLCFYDVCGGVLTNSAETIRFFLVDVPYI